MLDPTADRRYPPRLRMATVIVGFIVGLIVSLAPWQGVSAAEIDIQALDDQQWPLAFRRSRF